MTKEQLLWSRAVWKEGNREEEGVVPSSWILESQKLIYWPPKSINEMKALKERKPPDSNKWRKFPLVKVKFSSDVITECDDYNLTTTAEVSDTELEDQNLTQKRVPKKKTFPDCVSTYETDGTPMEVETGNITGNKTMSGDKTMPAPPEPPQKYNQGASATKSTPEQSPKSPISKSPARDSSSDSSSSGSTPSPEAVRRSSSRHSSRFRNLSRQHSSDRSPSYNRSVRNSSPSGHGSSSRNTSRRPYSPYSNRSPYRGSSREQSQTSRSKSRQRSRNLSRQRSKDRSAANNSLFTNSSPLGHGSSSRNISRRPYSPYSNRSPYRGSSREQSQYGHRSRSRSRQRSRNHSRQRSKDRSASYNSSFRNLSPSGHGSSSMNISRRPYSPYTNRSPYRGSSREQSQYGHRSRSRSRQRSRNHSRQRSKDRSAANNSLFTNSSTSGHGSSSRNISRRPYSPYSNRSPYRGSSREQSQYGHRSRSRSRQRSELRATAYSHSRSCSPEKSPVYSAPNSSRSSLLEVLDRIKNKTFTKQKTASPHAVASSNSASTTSQAQTATTSRKTPEKEKSPTFPMPNDKYQRRVLSLLVEIRDSLKYVGTMSTNIPKDKDFILDQVTTLDDFKGLETSLEDQQYENLVFNCMKTVGGATLKENVKRVMGRLMSNAVMSCFSLEGNSGKLAFSLSRVCKVVKDAVRFSKRDATDDDIMRNIGVHLKYAPDRKGGGGRKREKLCDDNS